MLECPSCRAENQPDQRFCGRCGASLRRACPSCGAENTPDFRFCGSCGSPLDAPTAPAPHAEERRWVSVVFADISGFTSLSETMDHEDVRTLADRCAELMAEKVKEFGGTVVSVMGDAVMAVFGAPLAHEDDAERAVRAAFAMRDAVAASGLTDTPLQVHAGVNTGEVMAGAIGPKERRDYTVMGDTTNTAARLMSAAEAGSVVVGAETHEATRNVIRYEAMDPVAAKGKQEPVEAWRAIESIAPPASRQVETTAPLIGRSEELAVLAGAWARTKREQRPHLVALIAPPGLGKTRLAREFVTRLRAEGAQYFVGRSLPYGGGTGYGAIAEQLRSAAGIDPSADPPAAREALTAHLRSLLEADDPDLLANLSVVLGVAGADVATDRPAMFLSLRRYVAALARKTQTVLVFEDVHWADQTTLDLISTLASRVHDAPLMLLCMARPELLDDQPSWGTGQPAYTALTLEPLSDESARELAAALLSNMPAEVAQRLVTAGGGNPLFLEELAATVGARHEGDRTHLPTSVKSIITARLDLLGAAERRAVQNAAVVGDVFWDGALAALDGVREATDLEETLERLESRGLIRRLPTSRVSGSDEFIFKHALIREVAYGIVSRASRRANHASVAAWLETVLGDRGPEMATLLAHHWREGGEAARAVDYMVLGAERASRAWAKAEAVELLTQALDLLEDAGLSERAAELRMLRGRAYTGLGDHANARADLEAAIPNLEGVAQARALLDRARVALMMVNADDIKRFARAAGEAAARFSDPELQARALLAASNGAMVDGDLDEAVALTSRSIDDWPPHARAGDPDYASATMWLGLYSYWKGELEPAAERSQHAIDLGLEAQALEPTTQAMAHLALSLAGMGRGSDAIRWFDRSVSLGLEWEAVPRFSSRSMNMWAGAARESLLDLEEARRLSTEGGELARRAAFPPGIESSKVDLVILDLAEGDVGRAEVDFPRVWESAMGVKGIHHWLFLIRLLEAKAAIAVARGRAEEGIEAAQEARKEARALPRLKYVAHSSLTLGRCLAAAKRPDEAIPLFESALDVASRVPHRATEWRAAAALAGACYAAGEDDRAAEAAARARKVVETFAEGLEGESSTRFLAASEISEILALSS